MTAEEVKAKLAKSGRLEDLKDQLAKIKAASSKVKAKKPVAENKGEAPSLQKFDHLKLEVPR